MPADQDLTEAQPKVTITKGTSITTVKAVLVDEHITVSWTVKSYPSQLKQGIAEAVSGCRSAMATAKSAT